MTMLTLPVIALTVLQALIMTPMRLGASCAVPPSPCAERARSSVIFYGKVLKVTPGLRTVAPGDAHPEQKVEFTVVQAVKGVKRGAFNGTFGLNSESTTFKEGDSYLVYAVPREGRLWTTCTRTTQAVTESELATVQKEMTTLQGCKH